MKSGSIKLGRVKTPKVHAPRANPAGRQRPPLGFPHVQAPRIKPTKTRSYGKVSPLADPSLEGGPQANSGFGLTGLTGET